MAKAARRVFGDLTNAADDAITYHSSLKAGGASNLEARSSPVCTKDFHILENTQDASCDFDALQRQSTPETRQSQPKDDTPAKVPPLPTQKVPQQAFDQVFVAGLHADLGKPDGLPELVALCAADLRDLWEQSVRTGGHRIMCMLQKFGNLGPQQGNLLRAAFFCPPTSAPPPPYAGAWPRRKTSTAARDAVTPAPADNHENLSNRGKPLPTIRRALASRGALTDDIEYRAESTLADLAHEMMRSCHQRSENSLPDAAAVLQNFPAQDREQALMWLFQVCASVNFEDSVLYLAVVLLDRFCVTLSAPVPLDRLQLVMVAVLSISLKMNGAIDENSKPPRLQDVLVHLSQSAFTVQEIFLAEHDVLCALGFAVATPTATELLDTFLMPHGISHQSTASSPVRCIAQFLLQLSLLDAPLHYRYSRAVLAAGAVYVALWVTQRPPEHVSALLEDVSACFSNDV